MGEVSLRCPFCGGKPLLREAVGESWVVCQSCQASTVMRTNKESAISAWNTRATDALLRRAAAALEPLYRIDRDGLGSARRHVNAENVEEASSIRAEILKAVGE